MTSRTAAETLEERRFYIERACAENHEQEAAAQPREPYGARHERAEKAERLRDQHEINAGCRQGDEAGFAPAGGPGRFPAQETKNQVPEENRQGESKAHDQDRRWAG